MKTSSAWLDEVSKVLWTLTLTLIAAVSLCIGLAFALPEATTTAETQPSKEARLREAWRVSMAKVPLPNKGTFVATYPNKQWKEVKSAKAPRIPFLPRRGPRPLIVGNGNMISAQAPTGLISSATGSFDSVTGVTSESGQINNTGPAVANAYSIQINTNFFASVDCAGSPNPGCRGWEQWVHFNDGTSGFALIQYWLIQYNKTCPQGWNQFSFPGSTDIYCYRNSNNQSGVPNQPISNLANLSFTGTVSAAGDSYSFSTGNTIYAGTGDNSVHAAAGWNTAEFCIVGPGGGSQANFNSGSKIFTRTKIVYGGKDPPNCVAQGFTGETNNLSFGPTKPLPSQPGPAVLVEESSAGQDPASCAVATSVGDTHLTTFRGLFYDFQASGDFVLAQDGPDFVVQARQVSGAPQWPHASVNSAVATRMGKTTVAISVGAKRLVINGKTTDLKDGKTVSTSDGVDVSRRGNVYYITSQSGNSVRATVNATWIDVLVGLGHCCGKTEAKGLLANANRNVNQLAARDGTVLTNPFAFKDLYSRYGDSWRVSPKESLLSVFGEKLEAANPRKLFYAHHLDPQIYKRSRAVSKAAGVKEGALLDAATLDVAVIGNEKAAQVFVGAHPPIAVGKIVDKK
jgi:hypothetical protein